MGRMWLIAAAILGFAAVALGAFGAHGLKQVLVGYSREIYEKAVLYQMFHTLALLAVGILEYQHPHLSLTPAGWAFVTGVVLFSGSLYALALTGLKWLGAITPLGGLAFLLGWIWLAYVLLKER